MRTLRLRNSTLNTFNSCPRKFEIEQLLKEFSPPDESPSTVFGTSYGLAVQSYLRYQDRNEALLICFLSYNTEYEDDKKNQFLLFNLMERSFEALDMLLLDYELVDSEVGLRVTDLPSSLPSLSIYFTGRIDVLLKHRHSRNYAVMDIKTTGVSTHDLAPMYCFSPQVIGYAAILKGFLNLHPNKEHAEDRGDSVENKSLYFVGRVGKRTSLLEKDTELYIFEKSNEDYRAWVKQLGLYSQQVSSLIEKKFFTQSGNCMAYLKPCRHFNFCAIQAKNPAYKDCSEDEESYRFSISYKDLLAMV
jgi:hypothetical protein